VSGKPPFLELTGYRTSGDKTCDSEAQLFGFDDCRSDKSAPLDHGGSLASGSVAGSDLSFVVAENLCEFCVGVIAGLAKDGFS